MKIEKNIPMPESQRIGDEFRQTMHKMEIGDSVQVDAGFANRVGGIGRGTSKKFAHRRVDQDKIRIWRTA